MCNAIACLALPKSDSLRGNTNAKESENGLRGIGVRSRSFLRDLDVTAEPRQSLEDAFARCRAAGLDFPHMIFGDGGEVQGF